MLRFTVERTDRVTETTALRGSSYSILDAAARGHAAQCDAATISRDNVAGPACGYRAGTVRINGLNVRSEDLSIETDAPPYSSCPSV